MCGSFTSSGPCSKVSLSGLTGVSFDRISMFAKSSTYLAERADCQKKERIVIEMLAILCIFPKFSVQILAKLLSSLQPFQQAQASFVLVHHSFLLTPQTSCSASCCRTKSRWAPTSECCAVRVCSCFSMSSLLTSVKNPGEIGAFGSLPAS